MECYVTPTRLRLKQRAQNVITSLSTLPHDHPMHGVLERTKRRVKRKKNHPKFPLAEAMRTMDIDQLEDLETINPRPLEPWRRPGFNKIDIETDKEAAIQKATRLLKTSETVIYTDASAKDSNLGAAAVIMSSNNSIRRSWQGGIGSAKYWNIHAAELIAIHQAVKMAQSEADEELTQDELPTRKFTIISDSQSALQTLARPSNKPGQAIVHHILDLAKKLQEHQVQLRLQWIPGHYKTPGNDTAAKEAVSIEEDHGFRHLVFALKRTNRDKMLEGYKRSGARRRKVSIYVKSTADYHPSGLNGYMAHYLGIEHIYSHNFEQAIPGWQHS